AIGLGGAIAAAFADGAIDEYPLLRIRIFSLFSPAALLGGAGLIINQDRNALHGAQVALRLIKIAAMADNDPVRQILRTRILFWFIGNDDDFRYPFRPNL